MSAFFRGDLTVSCIDVVGDSRGDGKRRDRKSTHTEKVSISQYVIFHRVHIRSAFEEFYGFLFSGA